MMGTDVMKEPLMIDSLMLFSPFQTVSLLLAPPVSNSQTWAAFPDISHFEFKFPVCLPSRLMFPHRAPPGSLSSLTADSSPPLSASWASQSIASSSNKRLPSAVLAERPPCCPLRPSRASCLGRTVSPWTQSPPTRAIPTTPDAPGDPTGTGKTKSCFVSSSVSSL